MEDFSNELLHAKQSISNAQNNLITSMNEQLSAVASPTQNTFRTMNAMNKGTLHDGS